MTDEPKISPLGDNAVTIDFGNEISLELNDRAIALAAAFTTDPFHGFIEAAPAYCSVAVFYDTLQVRELDPSMTAFQIVSEIVISRLERTSSVKGHKARVIEIPVDFGPDAALDIDFLTSNAGRSRDEVIDIFVSRSYRVFMIGFLPGFAYMGEVDERIAAPRRPTPRLKVPKGSVGIAGRQTGIYPLESPGGWQIIGRTEVEMFRPNDASMCLLRAGDEVRFVR